MPPKKTVQGKTYRVLNPKNIPKGIPILSWREFNWYEGDIFSCPEGMSVERILAQGFVEEVTDG